MEEKIKFDKEDYVTESIILNKKEYSDSLEMDFGGTGKRGKVYFDASHPDEAKERVSNMKEIALHAEQELKAFQKKVGEQ